MIIINCYGLDQYSVGHYSKNHTSNLAQLFETKEENIVFVAQDEFVFQNGIEQTSWQALIKVEAPEKYEPLEEKVASYLLKTMVDFAVHVRVVFEYFHGHHEHEFVNKEYPRFITKNNVVDVEEADEDEELFEGNIFEGMEEKLEEAYRDSDTCHCDENCECNDEHECEDECCCGHHHHKN